MDTSVGAAVTPVAMVVQMNVVLLMSSVDVVSVPLVSTAAVIAVPLVNAVAVVSVHLVSAVAVVSVPLVNAVVVIVVPFVSCITHCTPSQVDAEMVTPNALENEEARKQELHEIEKRKATMNEDSGESSEDEHDTEPSPLHCTPSDTTLIVQISVRSRMTPVPKMILNIKSSEFKHRLGDDDVVEITREQWDADAALKAAWDDSSDEWEESCTLMGWEYACTAFEAAAKARLPCKKHSAQTFDRPIRRFSHCASLQALDAERLSIVAHRATAWIARNI